MRATRFRALRALPRLARPAEPARLRALRLAGRLAGAPVRGVLGPPPRIRPRAVGDRVRRARSHVRALMEGEGPEAARGGSRSADRRRHRSAGRRPPRQRPGRPRARVGARKRRPEGARRRAGCTVGAPGRRSPPPAAFPSPTARPRTRGAPSQRPRQRCRRRIRSSYGLPRRRRLHIGSNRGCVCIRPETCRRTPSRGDHPRAGSALMLPAVNTVVTRRREPSRPRTQGAPIFRNIGATEDDGMRSVRSHARCGRIRGGEHID